jgi:hypothetical protein
MTTKSYETLLAEGKKITSQKTAMTLTQLLTMPELMLMTLSETETLPRVIGGTCLLQPLAASLVRANMTAM